MIDYKAIGFEDLKTIREYLRWEDVQGCEWSGINLLTWNQYGLEYAIVEGFLVLRFLYDGQFTYTMPLPPVPEGIEHPRLGAWNVWCARCAMSALPCISHSALPT